MKKIIITIIGVFLFNIAYSFDISTNADWYPSTIPTFTGDIIIKNGVTLNIHPGCTLTMTSNSKIIVERNARLIIDNSLITASGSWDGIRCNNGAGAILSTDRIPYVNIKKNSTITKAHLAFANYYTNTSGITYYGGAIIATEVDFLNNTQFLYIKNYIYNQKSFEVCTFSRCKFREIATCHISTRFIEIDNSENVNFYGCEFVNNCPSPRTGIMIRDSKVKISRYYKEFPSYEKKSKFKGFSNGIMVINNALLGRKVSISYCVFNTLDQNAPNDNQTSISILDGNNPQIFSNTFNIFQGNNTWSQTMQNKTAIVVSDCPSFYIEGNVVNFTGVNQLTTGIIMGNSGIKTNQIYRNTINNATVGIIADGQNRSNATNYNTANQGLKFLCNTFTNFNNGSYYFKVTNCNNSTYNYGISRWQQGALKNSQGTIAGSPCFNSTPDRSLNVNADNDFLDEHTTVGSNWDVKYFYPTNPVDYTVRYVSKDNNNNKKISFEEYTAAIPTDKCESRLPCVGIHCPVLMGPMTIIASFPQLLSIKFKLNQLVNAGDHDALYILVLNVSTSNVSDVYNDLLNSTPSLDILALACGNDIFTPVMIENILIANSYGIKSESVRNALESRETKLSDQQMDNIYQAAESISDYEDLLMQEDVINQEYTSLMNQSISALQGRDIIPMDSIKMYLEAFNDLWSNIRLIDIAFNENNTSHAQELFNNLSNISEEEDELNNYNLLYNNVLSDIYTNHDGDFAQMTSSQKNDLYSIYTNGTYAAGIAKYLLIKYDDLQWELNYCESNSGNSERRAKPIELETISEIEIYPNPATNSINIELPACDNCETIYSIYDLSGRKLIQNTISESKNTISVSNLPDGTYFIHLVSGNKTTTQKLIILK